MKDLVKLHDCYSDVFDPRFLNSSLFDTTVELIKEVTKLKEDMSAKLEEIERISDEQKSELTNVKAEIDSKIQQLSNEIKDTVKYCIDPSKQTTMNSNEDITLPYDAYVCLEMSAAWDSYCQLLVNGVIIQKLGAEDNQRCRSAVAVVCKKGDIVRILTHGNNGGVLFASYFGLK